MQNIYSNPSKLTRTCRGVLSWSHVTQSYLSTQILIRSSGCFLFIAIACASFLVQVDISFSLSWPVQTKPCKQTFSYYRHNQQKITYPYKQTFTFLCCGLHRPVHPQGHLLLTDFLIHAGAF